MTFEAIGPWQAISLRGNEIYRRVLIQRLVKSDAGLRFIGGLISIDKALPNQTDRVPVIIGRSLKGWQRQDPDHFSDREIDAITVFAAQAMLSSDPQNAFEVPA